MLGLHMLCGATGCRKIVPVLQTSQRWIHRDCWTTLHICSSICTLWIDHSSCVFARWRHSAMKFLNKKLMTVFSIVILEKCTDFHAIRSWSFQNICSEIGWPRFLRHPVLQRRGWAAEEDILLYDSTTRHGWWLSSLVGNAKLPSH